VPDEKRVVRYVLLGVLMTVVIAAVALGAYALGNRGAASSGSPVTPSPSRTPLVMTPVIRPSPIPPEVKENFPLPAEGARLNLIVIPQQTPEKACVAHAFRVPPDGLLEFRGYLRAYSTECLSWKRDGYDLYFYFVDGRERLRPRCSVQPTTIHHRGGQGFFLRSSECAAEGKNATRLPA
jgi:hypothetical protein